MVCVDKAQQIAALGLGLAISRLMGPPTVPMQSIPANSQAENQTELAQCEESISPDWKLNECGRFINIFMDATSAEDVFALTAIIRQSDKLMKEKGCSPEQYPIKMIVTGGTSRSSEDDKTTLDNYLQTLDQDNPAPLYDTLRGRIREGPTSNGTYSERYHDHPHAWIREWQSKQGLSGPWRRAWQGSRSGPAATVWRTLPGTMDILIDQVKEQNAAPIIVALRPLFEFIPLWVERQLEANPTEFAVIDTYASRARPSALTQPGWTTPDGLKGKILDALEAIQKSRVCAVLGYSTFKQMGLFLENEVMDLELTPDHESKVVALEESFVNWPDEFILVDEVNMIGHEGRVFSRLFSGANQQEFFVRLQLSHTVNLIKDFITEANRYMIEVWEKHIAYRIQRMPWNDGLPTAREDSVKIWKTLREKAQEMSQGFFEGADDDDFGTTFKASTNVLAMWLMRCYAEKGKPKLGAESIARLNDWFFDAPLNNTRVLLTSTLLPFLFDPAPSAPGNSPNTVLASLQKVTYGRNPDGSYHFPLRRFSPSGFWFTNATWDLSWYDAHAMAARVEEELAELYIKAWTPA